MRDMTLPVLKQHLLPPTLRIVESMTQTGSLEFGIKTKSAQLAHTTLPCFDTS